VGFPSFTDWVSDSAANCTFAFAGARFAFITFYLLNQFFRARFAAAHLALLDDPGAVFPVISSAVFVMTG
jgi:hypothetical protein